MAAPAGMVSYMLVALHLCVGLASLHAGAASCSTNRHDANDCKVDIADEVSLLQVSRPRILATDAANAERDKLWKQPTFELDDHPMKNYNFGVRWNEWYDDMISRFPPTGGGYSTANYGLATSPLHRCAAKTSPGEPGDNWPFNKTSGSNMYATLASKSPRSLANAEVLEVSSGRGGGAALLSDCFCPSKMVGLDFSPKHVESSQSNYGRNGSCPIEFVNGDAMDLPFQDESFDVVVNVEASHTFPSYRTFINEVHRVLRPGGSFLTVDLRSLEDADTDSLIMEKVFDTSVFPMDITEMVLRSFEENKLIEPFVAACEASYEKDPMSTPTIHSGNTTSHCAHFAGIGFTAPRLRDHKWTYRMYVLQKGMRM